jgi:hypothetical protein
MLPFPAGCMSPPVTGFIEFILGVVAGEPPLPALGCALAPPLPVAPLASGLMSVFLSGLAPHPALASTTIKTHRPHVHDARAAIRSSSMTASTSARTPRRAYGGS